MKGLHADVSVDVIYIYSGHNRGIAEDMLVGDNSNVTRNQIKSTLEQIDVEITEAENGSMGNIFLTKTPFVFSYM